MLIQEQQWDLRSMTLTELETLMEENSLPKFRAGQLFDWFHRRHAASFDDMNNIPKNIREMLQQSNTLVTLSKLQCLVSEIDGTRKYLFALPDHNVIESVWMQYKHGNSVCVSTQVGCRMGCRFCASTLDGLVRNLRASEILEQIYRIVEDTGKPVSNIVLMGSGEPMDNFDNVSRFVSLISDPKGMNLSKRNITISTCGLIPGIRRLQEEHPQVTLALSLHAPNDQKRKEIMPVANAFALTDIISACREYYDTTGRRVSFEYSLIQGVNDNPEEAQQLSRLLKGFPCHVNLIPVNPIKERDFKRSDMQGISAFKNLLEKNGINVTIRREMGQDIQGACGQLRKSYLDSEAPKQEKT